MKIKDINSGVCPRSEDRPSETNQGKGLEKKRKGEPGATFSGVNGLAEKKQSPIPRNQPSIWEKKVGGGGGQDLRFSIGNTREGNRLFLE